MQYKQRIERAESRLKPINSIVVLIERGNTEKEKADSIDEQWANFLANGGNIDASQIIVRFIAAESQRGTVGNALVETVR